MYWTRDSPTGHFKCSDCPYKARNVNDFGNHLANVHPDPNKPPGLKIKDVSRARPAGYKEQKGRESRTQSPPASIPPSTCDPAAEPSGSQRSTRSQSRSTSSPSGDSIQSQAPSLPAAVVAVATSSRSALAIEPANGVLNFAAIPPITFSPAIWAESSTTLADMDAPSISFVANPWAQKDEAASRVPSAEESQTPPRLSPLAEDEPPIASPAWSLQGNQGLPSWAASEQQQPASDATPLNAESQRVLGTSPFTEEETQSISGARVATASWAAASPQRQASEPATTPPEVVQRPSLEPEQDTSSISGTSDPNNPPPPSTSTAGPPTDLSIEFLDMLAPSLKCGM